SNAPPPPRYHYYREPDVVLVPNTRVYVVEDDYDDDMFRYGGYWYTYHDDFWYLAPTYRGPFMVFGVRRVPRAIIQVPPGHWHHRPHWDGAYGPRYVRGGYERRGHGNDNDQGNGRGRGHGNGHGRGHDDD